MKPKSTYINIQNEEDEDRELIQLLEGKNAKSINLDEDDTTDDIKEIKIKNFALLNSKIKRIEINTTDGKSHKLYARVEEKDFPYHKDNFAAFMEKYGNK